MELCLKPEREFLVCRELNKVHSLVHAMTLLSCRRAVVPAGSQLKFTD